MAIKNVSKGLKFFFIDGFAAIPLVLTLVHIRIYTLVITALLVISLTVLRHLGLRTEWLWRFLRSRVAGNDRSARPYWRKNI